MNCVNCGYPIRKISPAEAHIRESLNLRPVKYIHNGNDLAKCLGKKDLVAKPKDGEEGYDA